MPGDGPRGIAPVRRRDFGPPGYERKRFLEHLDARVRCRGYQRTPRPAGRLLELIDDEEVRLEELLTIHLEREAAAGERLAFDDSDPGEWLRRYQLTFNRTLLRILETLRKRRKDAGGASGRVPVMTRRADWTSPVAVGPACSPLLSVGEFLTLPSDRPKVSLISVGRALPSPRLPRGRKSQYRVEIRRTNPPSRPWPPFSPGNR